MPKDLWVCDRCHKLFDPAYMSGRLRYDVTIADTCRNRVDHFYICSDCHVHVWDVIHLGKMAVPPAVEATA